MALSGENILPSQNPVVVFLQEKSCQSKSACMHCISNNIHIFNLIKVYLIKRTNDNAWLQTTVLPRLCHVMGAA
jgi:hypothetical protein